MTRYIRLYLYFLRFSFSRAMEFRVDFFFRVGMDSLFYVTQMAFFWVVYQHTPTLADWTLDQVLVFAAGVFVADAIHMTFFSNNMWMFPFLVNKGDLDYYIVRPISSLFFVSVREFAANSFLNLLIASGILVWAIWRYPDPIGGGSVALYLALLGLGCLLNYALNMLFMIPVFWMHNAAGLRDTFWGLTRFTGRPDGIFTGWVRRVLTSILPFAIVVSFPTRALFGDEMLAITGHMTLVVGIAFLLLVVTWRLGLRAYASASS